MKSNSLSVGNDDPADSGSQWWGDGAENKAGTFSVVSSGGGIAITMQTDQYPGWPLKAPQTVVNDVLKRLVSCNGDWGLVVGRVSWGGRGTGEVALAGVRG